MKIWTFWGANVRGFGKNNKHILNYSTHFSIFVIKKYANHRIMLQWITKHLFVEAYVWTLVTMQSLSVGGCRIDPKRNATAHYSSLKGTGDSKLCVTVLASFSNRDRLKFRPGSYHPPPHALNGLNYCRGFIFCNFNI